MRRFKIFILISHPPPPQDTLQKEFKTQLDAMRNQRDALQTQLAHASSEHAKSMMELEKNLLSKLSESRAHQHKEIETLEGKISHFASNNSSLQQQLLDEKSRFEREKKVFEERIASFERDAASRMEKEVAIWKREVEKGQAEVHKRDNEITSLKEQNRKLNLEMDERDEDNVVKMKELQVAISTLISSRSARGRK